jgi:acetolactate synthase-1/3 small subunit
MQTARSERHTLTALVDNEAGVLARVVGLFSGRGYNIESLTVGEVDPTGRTSRITIVTAGPPSVIEQIEAQLKRLVPVHAVTNWTFATDGIEREMALVKVSGSDRAEAKKVAEKLGARILDDRGQATVFELTDAPANIGSFIETMRPLGLSDVSRTGVAAISRDTG